MAEARAEAKHDFEREGKKAWLNKDESEEIRGRGGESRRWPWE
jgi:hypothetical protein